ncbi:hypothetical protein JXA85_02130 [Candidatus Woesearchaeota archaeon]|nr:hypothetical protein [Candidatus Woesearchaeota archaeon]
MNDVIKRDILEIITRILDIVKEKDFNDAAELSKLSDRTIHDASIFQDEDSIGIAVVAYALSKLYVRTELVSETMKDLLRRAYNNLLDNNPEGYRKKIKEILKQIGDEDKKLGLYIQEVIKQAEIKKGSRIYEHGISLARAAEILGVSQWELSYYVSQTTIADDELERVPIKDRLNFARGLFK